MCSLSILNFVSSNRIDRLEVSIVFHEDSEISVKSQGVYLSKVILGTVFFVYYHRFFVLIVTSLSFDRFLWLLFIRHNSFLIIHLLLQLLFNSFYKILYIYIYIRDKIEDNAIEFIPNTDIAVYLRYERATVRVQAYAYGQIQSNPDYLCCNESTSWSTL